LSQTAIICSVYLQNNHNTRRSAQKSFSQVVTLSAFSRMCLSATSGDLIRRPSTALSADTRTPFNLSLLLPRTTYSAETQQITLKTLAETTSET